MKSFYISFLLLTIISTHQLFAQAGNLDSTFSNDGLVITPIGTNNDVAFAVFEQPDGKIVAIGNTKSGDYDIAVTRYNSDGTLDASFGTNGIVITDIGTLNDHAIFAALRPNGKIVAAGDTYNGTDYDFAVAQYNTDGTLDVNFGTNGTVSTNIGTGDNKGYGMALQNDGKVVVGGYAFIDPPQGYSSDFAIARYDTTGTLDPAFGINGIVTTDFDSTTETPHDVKIESSGKIIVGGEIDIDGHFDFALARYNSNGTLDVSFSNDGKVTTDLDSNAYVYSIVLQLDGKIIAAGHAGDLPNGDFAMARYNKDGSIDSTFGINGIVLTDIAGSDDAIYAVTLQPDGKILAAGYSFSTGLTQRYGALARYNDDGSLDNSFGTGGKVVTDFGNTGDEFRGMCLQQDGKIVTCGYTNNGSDDDFALARYLTDLVLGVINFSSQQTPVFIFPNPLQQTEQIEYTLNEDETLSITLYDASGRLVQSFITNESRKAGEHKEQLKMLTDLAAGNYVLSLSNGSHSFSVKMIKR